MEDVTLTAAKMSCSHCKMAVENAGNALEGVSSIDADPDSKKVAITYDESVVTVDAIKQALAEAGYPAESA